MQGKSLCLLFVIIFSHASHAQDDDTSFAFSIIPDRENNQGDCSSDLFCSNRSNSDRLISVDDYVRGLNTKGERGKDIEFLSHLLTDSIKNDSLKVRAVFYWITQHIAYDVKQRNGNKTDFLRFRKKQNHKEAVENWELERARTDLVRKKGVAGDNALLFYYLCKFAGVECKVLESYGINNYRKFNSSSGEKAGKHIWNAVLVNNRWYVLDVTLASGYCDEKGRKFTRRINEFYYLTPPDQLIYYSGTPNRTFSIKSNAIVVKMEITNLRGEKVYSKKINSDKSEIDLRRQKHGIYFVKLISNTGKVVVKKLVVDS